MDLWTRTRIKILLPLKLWKLAKYTVNLGSRESWNICLTTQGILEPLLNWLKLLFNRITLELPLNWSQPLVTSSRESWNQAYSIGLTWKLLRKHGFDFKGISLNPAEILDLTSKHLKFHFQYTIVNPSWNIVIVITRKINKQAETSAVRKKNPAHWPDGYAMLMSPNKGETAVHGCQCPGDMVVRMRKVLAISRSW